MGVFRRLQRGKLAERYSIRFQLADGTRKTIATDATTEAKALEYLAVMEAKVREEKIALLRKSEVKAQPQPSLTLSQACERAYAEHWSGNRTGGIPRRHVAAIIQMFGDLPLESIDGAFLGKLKVALLEKGNSAATINRYFATLKTLVRMAHYDWAVLKTVPRFRMSSEKGAAREFTFTDSHLTAIRDYFVSKELHEMVDVVDVLIDTGMRLGELFQLTAQHIDLSARVISIHGSMAKSKHARSIPMTDRVHEVTARRLRLYKGSTLFSMAYHTCESRWRRMKLELNLPQEAVIHCLRHTCASRLVQKGVDLYSVQRLLGHSSPVVTTRYAHLQLSTLQQAVELLN